MYGQYLSGWSLNSIARCVLDHYHRQPLLFLIVPPLSLSLSLSLSSSSSLSSRAHKHKQTNIFLLTPSAGGPLIIPGTTPEEDIQVGIVDFGRDCADREYMFVFRTNGFPHALNRTGLMLAIRLLTALMIIFFTPHCSERTLRVCPCQFLVRFHPFCSVPPFGLSARQLRLPEHRHGCPLGCSCEPRRVISTGIIG